LSQLSSNAHAGAAPALTNLDANQTSAVLKTFGTNFAFKPIESASDFGKNWGLSAGIGGGITSGTAITDAIPGVDASAIPNANLIFGLQGPLGLGLELGLLPSVKFSGLTFNTFGADVKWNIGSGLGRLLPIDVAARLMYSTTSLSYTETIASLTDTISISTHAVGFNVSASKKLFIIEPYVGLGFMSQSGTLSNTGTITLFNSSLTSGSSYDSSNSGLWTFVGLQWKLLILNLTAEYDNIMGIGSGSLKASLKF